MSKATRKPLSKKLRFEVFKKDKFTCQYCGKKAPDVILEVDHIHPVSLGGTNEILNLITSCQACNSGKKATPLDKDIVLDKQRQKLEELQARREQIEMMFEWKKSLDNLGEHSVCLLTEYVEDNIYPYTLNDTGRRNIENMIKKFSFDEIFAAIDRGKQVYLKYDAEGNLEQESVENFINRLTGIIINNKRTPIEQQIHYIKGICKNRFQYWNDQKGLAILKEYANALRDRGWSDDSILLDLKSEASDLAKDARNWSQWQEAMENWICDIKDWDKKEITTTPSSPLDITQIEQQAKGMMESVIQFFSLIKYLNVPFGDANENRLLSEYLQGINTYLTEQIAAFRGTYKIDGEVYDIDCLEPIPPMAKSIASFLRQPSIDNDLKFCINELCLWYLPQWMESWYFPNMDIYCEKDAVLFKKYYDEFLEESISSLLTNISNSAGGQLN